MQGLTVKTKPANNIYAAARTESGRWSFLGERFNKKSEASAGIVRQSVS
jgi:hypothetical protein